MALPSLNMAINGPCVCADYIEEECGHQDNCEWYADGDSCRTSVWVECQNNPDCRLIVHVDHHYEREERQNRGNSNKHSVIQQDSDSYDWRMYSIIDI